MFNIPFGFYPDKKKKKKKKVRLTQNWLKLISLSDNWLRIQYSLYNTLFLFNLMFQTCSCMDVNYLGVEIAVHLF